MEKQVPMEQWIPEMPFDSADYLDRRVNGLSWMDVPDQDDDEEETSTSEDQPTTG
jgi:hypothetical protein